MWKGGFLEGAIPKVNSRGSEEVRVMMGKDIQIETTSRWLVEYIDPGQRITLIWFYGNGQSQEESTD